jgi:hypothetical protein
VAPAMFEMYVRQRPPWFRPEDYAHMLDRLRKAAGRANPDFSYRVGFWWSARR